MNLTDNELFESLSTELSRKFRFHCEIFPLEVDLTFAFNTRRNQYSSSKIIQRLSPEMPEDGLRILIIVDVDFYVPELRFVFGEAELGGPAAIISLARLRPEFYRMKPDRDLYRERTVKEAVHELGHTFGLTHCGKSSCVMVFSKSLLDTDRKMSTFCQECGRKLHEPF